MTIQGVNLFEEHNIIG
uniref:Uncharacterized protein n=1 Tax=Rhizophora mucronata TaxID=61149 RepID=A0A2P2MX34_RHIMU